MTEVDEKKNKNLIQQKLVKTTSTNFNGVTWLIFF